MPSRLNTFGPAGKLSPPFPKLYPYEKRPKESMKGWQELHLSLLHPGKVHKSTLCCQTHGNTSSIVQVCLLSLALPVHGRTFLETRASYQCPLSSATWPAMTNGMQGRSQSYVQGLRGHKSLLTSSFLCTTEVGSEQTHDKSSHSWTQGTSAKTRCN